MRRTRLAFAVLLLSAIPALAAGPFKPDPASVRRYGPAYRYPQHGWIVLHIEGEPFDRGYQHGRLMAAEIAGYVKALAQQQSTKAPADGWKLTRTLVGAVFLRKFDREYLDEMRGIADGAAAAGAKFDDRPIDLLDIAGLNVAMEYDTLDAALEAQPTGLEGVKFPKPAAPRCCPPPSKDHCSAFAATGPATADGKLVIGHITMSGLYNALYTNVWLDVQPAKGHRVVMQANPGGIWSAQDYYINSAGLVLTETTLTQTQFNPDGIPLASRTRKAIQYGSSIDEIAKELTTKNNGLYANEWLIGDANTNEIAALELGTHATRLRRSSKGEWQMPGVEGFYWGCNNTKDLGLRMETVPGALDRPHDMAWRPSDRDKAWLKLYQQYRGKIDAEFGKMAFATPPLSAHPSMDAKVTTAAMAKRLESHGVFGPPYQKVYSPTFEQRNDYTDIKGLVPNDWTLLTPAAPAPGKSETADIAERVGDKSQDDPSDDPPTAPAWHGTILPKSDATVWLTAGFAGYERVVALENALKERSDGKLTDADKERIELALFRHRSAYLSAKAARPAWRTAGGEAPSALTVELDRDRWHQEQAGLGVLALQALRGFVGDEKFAPAMDAVGRKFAGKEVSSADFIAALGKETGKDVAGFLKGWTAEPPIGGGPLGFGVFTATQWLDDPEHAVIVYGTGADKAANEGAAKILQEAVRVKWSNIVIPVKADRETTDSDLTGRHVILIGRPAVNAVTKRLAAAFPVKFGPASVRVNDKLYAHELTAVVAAGTNPADSQYSAVVIAGLSADATYRLPSSLMKKETPAEAIVFPNGGKPIPLVVTATKK